MMIFPQKGVCIFFIQHHFEKIQMVRVKEDNDTKPSEVFVLSMNIKQVIPIRKKQHQFLHLLKLH